MQILFLLLLFFNSTIFGQYDDYYYQYDENTPVTVLTPEPTPPPVAAVGTTEDSPTPTPDTTNTDVGAPAVTVTNYVIISETNTITNNLTNYVSLPQIAPISINACVAVVSGSLSELKQFVERDPSIINKQRGDGNTLLHLAASKPNSDIIAYLLGQGSNIDQTNASGRTPLHVASLNNNKIGAYELLQSNASVFLKDNRGQTPTGIANIKNYPDLLKILLQFMSISPDNNAPLPQPKIIRTDVPSNFDLYKTFTERLADNGPLLNTPWHKATFIPGYQAIARLVNAGQTPYDKDKVGRNAFHLAALYDNSVGLEFLLDRYPIRTANNTDHFGATPLHIASGKASPETVSVLINKGCNINVRNKGGWTPFYEAVLLNNPAVVRYFLEQGISPNTRTPKGRTPLHEAALQGANLIVRDLLDAGALFDVSDYQGQTPFYLAAQQGDIETTALLFDKGADINTTDKDDKNALHAAVENNQIDMVRYLTSVAKINIFQPDRLGRTPLDIAYINGYADIINILATEYSREPQ